MIRAGFLESEFFGRFALNVLDVRDSLFLKLKNLAASLRGSEHNIPKHNEGYPPGRRETRRGALRWGLVSSSLRCVAMALRRCVVAELRRCLAASCSNVLHLIQYILAEMYCTTVVHVLP